MPATLPLEAANAHYLLKSSDDICSDILDARFNYTVKDGKQRRWGETIKVEI